MVKRAMILACIIGLLFVAPVVASNGEDIPSFDKFLEDVSGPLVTVAVGFFISLLLDYWSKYGELGTAQKRIVYGVLCLVLPVGAATLRGAMGYAPWSFDPLIWQALYRGVAAWLAGTGAHIKTKSVAKKAAAS